MVKLTVNENYEMVFEDVFNAIVIKTDSGDFGICQRDFGIVVMKDGKEVFNSDFPIDIDKAVLDTKLQALWNEQNVKFNACEDPDGSTYLSGYLKAIEVIRLLLQ